MNSKLLTLLLILIMGKTGLSQVFIESSPVGTSPDGALIVYGSTNLNNTKLPYEKIKGSPFWNNEFRMATLVDPQEKLLGKVPTRINLYTNEVYFKTPTGEERVAAPGRVRKVIFDGLDSAKKEFVVFDNSLPIAFETYAQVQQPPFVLVLNTGDYQLLKQMKISLLAEDSLMGTLKRYKFSIQVKYYIHNKYSQATRLKRLNRENVVENLNLTPIQEAWIKDEKINFKEELSVIKFLNYYNSTSEK